MGMLMNLMTTLYFDMKTDKKTLLEEKNLVVSKYKQLYNKTDIRKLSKKQKITLKIFKFSPNFSYLIRRTNILMRRIKNGK